MLHNSLREKYNANLGCYSLAFKVCFFYNMSIIRMYRKFYCVSTSTTPNSYTLITPTSLSASTYVAGSGGTESTSLIQADLALTEEETGIFYTDLKPELYASDVTYDLVFYVQYTPGAPPNKKLTVRFRIKAANIINQLDYELGDVSRTIEIDTGDGAIGIEILDGSIDIEKTSQEVEHYINNNGGSIDIEIK